MTRIGDVLGRKYTIDILLYLLDRDTSPTKFDVFKALGCHKVVASRIDEIESDGLVEVCRDGGRHNPHHITLTWYGRKIAVALRECNYLFEKITS